MSNDNLVMKIHDQVSTSTRQYSGFDMIKKNKNDHTWSWAQEWLTDKHSYRKLKTPSILTSWS